MVEKNNLNFKKTTVSLIVCFLACTFSANTQNSEKKNKTFYVFERFDNTKTTQLSQGNNLIVRGAIGDTTFVYTGHLISADSTKLTVDLRRYSRTFTCNGYTVNDGDYNLRDSIVDIQMIHITEFEKENYRPMIPTFIALYSFITAAVVAPLASIDRDSPKNFNLNRYANILKYSAATFVASAAVGGILSVNKRHTFKPKLIAIKYH